MPDTQYFKVGTDVYSGTNPSDIQAIDLPTFKSLGLNIDLLGQGVGQGKTLSQMGVTSSANTNPSFSSGAVPVDKLTGTPTINSTNQSSTPNYNAIQAGVMASYGIDPNASVTAQNNVNTAEQSVKDLMAQVTNEQTDTNNLNNQYGVNEKSQLVNDLTSQLTQLNAEAVAEQTQNRARAQSGTFLSAGLNQDQNAVESNRAIKALQIGAQLDIANNNLTSATNKVTQAINLKYQPILAQLDSWKTMYSMYRDDLSAAEKKVGDAQATAMSIYQDQVKQQQAQETQNTTFALNSSADHPDAKISPTDSPEVVNQKILSSTSYAKSLITGGGNSNITTDNERALLNQFNSEPIVKDFNVILAKKMSVDQIIKSGVGGPGDLALVYEFMKGLDPSSVVRESEYASAASSGNIFAGALAKFNGYFKASGGFLPPQVQSAFQSIVNSKLKVQQQLYDNVVKQYQGVAVRQGLNPQNVTLDYSAGAGSNNVIDNYIDKNLPVTSPTDNAPSAAVSNWFGDIKSWLGW